jgi:hypothetical protein
MRSFPTAIILTICILIVASTGCQVGKSPVGNFAWWKKDDTLASRYIEPPSHQFTPSESAVVSDDPDLPPLPPDIEKTVETFEEDVARSYRELARQAGQISDKALDPVREATDKLEKLAVASDSAANSSEFLNPLVPRSVDSGGVTNDDPQAKAAMSEQPASGVSSTSNEFQPYRATPRYEQLAQQTLQPLDPGALQAAEPQRSSTAAPLQPYPSGDSSPAGEFVVPDPGTFSPSWANSQATPLSPSRPEAAAATADSQQVNYEYPSTPFPEFQPRMDEPGDTPQTLTQGAATTTSSGLNSSGLELQLQGQGSYAPGSIRTPDPIDPGQLRLPMNVDGSGSN